MSFNHSAGVVGLEVGQEFFSVYACEEELLRLPLEFRVYEVENAGYFFCLLVHNRVRYVVEDVAKNGGGDFEVIRPKRNRVSLRVCVVKV